MITAEMKSMIIRDQLMNDIADIKTEMLKLKVELELIKELLSGNKDGKR